MRAIIAGGTGLLGTRLSRTMVERGWEVFVLTRNQTVPLPVHQQESIQFQQWDTKTTKGWGHLFNQQTVLINLAGTNPGAKRWNQEFKNEILESRLQTISCMTEAIQTYQPVAYLQASATGIYGNHSNFLRPITDTEDSPLFYAKPNSEGEQFRQEVCQEIEKKSSEAVLNTSTTCMKLRLGIIFSNSGGLYPYLTLGSKFGCSRIGTGNQIMSWIHESDCASAIEFLSRNPSTGHFNIVAPNYNTNLEVMKSISLHEKPWNFICSVPLPGFIFEKSIGEAASLVLDSQPVVPQRLLDMKFSFDFPTIDSCTKNLITTTNP